MKIYQQKSKSSHESSFETSLELLKSVLKYMGYEFLLISRDGDIVFANEAAQKGLGYSLSELKKKKIFELYKEKLSSRAWKQRIFNKVKKSTIPISFEIKRIVKSGAIKIVEVIAVYMPFENEEYIISIGRDITDRINRFKEKSDYAKMDALSLFVAGTAQEIKYPLDAILSHLRRLLRKYEHREFEYIGYKEFKDMLSMISQVTQKMEQCCKITENLLLLNKEKAGIKQEGCQANSVVRNCLTYFKPEMDSLGISFVCSIDKKNSFVWVNEVDLKQIVSNILANSLQAMPNGGKVHLSTKYLGNERKVYIRIKDSGTGIAKEHLNRVFDAFFTTRQGRSQRNIGLGLSVVYSIIKKANGDIQIKSNLRQGTTTTIILPAKLIPKKK